MNKSESSFIKRGKRLKIFLKKHVHTIIFLILLTVIVSLITYWRVIIQIEIGLISDSVDFFSNALIFAGQGFGYSDLIRPPFFSFITSIFVRMGFTSINTIFAVDGGIFVFGVIGFFLLLKTHFNDLESFLGGLLYATFPIVLTVLGVGFSDLASVSFSIWTIYFMVLAVKTDSKFFYLLFPFVMFAFLTRYNSALLIIPIFLYILINKDRVNIKKVIMGIIASILIIVPVLIFYFEKFGNILYPFMNFGSTSSTLSVPAENFSYDPNIFFFLEKFPSFVGAQGFTIILIVASGVILYLLLGFIRKNHYKINFTGFNFKNKVNNIKLIMLIIIGIVFIGTFASTFYMVSELLFFIFAYLIYDLSKNMKLRDMDTHLMFFAWFMAFFIFHSIFVIKDNRYFVIMAPPVAYFMILGLSEISNRIKFPIKNRNLTFPLFAILLTSIMLLATASHLPFILETNNDKKVANENMEQASQWLISYDMNYLNENIYSDLWPNFSWYLKTNVKIVPIFKDGQLYYGGIKDNYFTQQDSDAFNEYLNENNADYYISIRQGLNLRSYKPIKQFGIVIIYKKT